MDGGEGGGGGEEQSLTFSSRVRSFENRIFDRITFFFFFSFFLRGWYVLLISRLKSRGEIGARDDARDEILK